MANDLAQNISMSNLLNVGAFRCTCLVVTRRRCLRLEVAENQRHLVAVRVGFEHRRGVEQTAVLYFSTRCSR